MVIVHIWEGNKQKNAFCCWHWNIALKSTFCNFNHTCLVQDRMKEIFCICLLYAMKCLCVLVHLFIMFNYLTFLLSAAPPFLFLCVITDPFGKPLSTVHWHQGKGPWLNWKGFLERVLWFLYCKRKSWLHVSVPGLKTKCAVNRQIRLLLMLCWSFGLFCNAEQTAPVNCTLHVYFTAIFFVSDS